MWTVLLATNTDISPSPCVRMVAASNFQKVAYQEAECEQEMPQYSDERKEQTLRKMMPPAERLAALAAMMAAEAEAQAQARQRRRLPGNHCGKIRAATPERQSRLNSYPCKGKAICTMGRQMRHAGAQPGARRGDIFPLHFGFRGSRNPGRVAAADAQKLLGLPPPVV